jgi:hypothetical protein
MSSGAKRERIESDKVFDMNCQEFRENIGEAVADADLLEHSAECEACAALLGAHARLRAGLRTLAAELRHTEAPARVELGLVAAFRSQHRRAGRVGRRQWWIPALSWATAAGVVIAAALFLLRPHQPLPAHRLAPGSVETASMTDAPDAYPAEGDDGFIAVPNAPRLDPNEAVNIVRVEVPRSAMLEVGLAVSADRVSEPVEADVVLGPDGLARAIRFVDEPEM